MSLKEKRDGHASRERYLIGSAAGSQPDPGYYSRPESQAEVDLLHIKDQ